MPQVRKKGRSSSKVGVKYSTHTEKTEIKDPSELSSSIIIHLKPSETADPDFFEDETSLLSFNYDPSVFEPSAYDNTTNSFFHVEHAESIPEEQSVKEDNNNAVRTSDLKTLSGEVWCWWCCHPFENERLQLPLHLRPDKKVECMGTFCSFECVCAYNMECGKKYGDCWEQLELLYSLTDRKTKITPAPHREELIQFGGKMTIEEFRKKKVQSVLIHPPMVSLKLHMDDLPANENKIPQNTEKKTQPSFFKIDALVTEENTKKKRISKKSKPPVSTLDKFVEMN